MKSIVYDEWLSKILGKQSFFLENSNNLIFKEKLLKKNTFIWTKISTLEIEKLINFQKMGFSVVDTNVQLQLNYFKKKYLKNFIRFARPEDEKSIKAIAKNSFKLSRFNMDPKISKKIASKIKVEWASNYFSGKRGEWMIVAEYKSKIVGFLQLLKKSNNTIIIDLIAVNEKYRGKGIAKNMISFAYFNCLKNLKSIEVGTQISNSSSINMYTKLGFSISSSFYVLHMHKKK
ncbi:MAG: hypothetical protein CBC25_07610 [Pelagibacteraceae bacterium TMED65]|nr:MAG: hypothetical protein CBC25_07610 [Pelagibacteraceae bacterium TMED65]